MSMWEKLVKRMIKTCLLAGASITFVGIGMLFTMKYFGCVMIGMGVMSMFISLLIWIEKRKIDNIVVALSLLSDINVQVEFLSNMGSLKVLREIAHQFGVLARVKFHD